MNTAHQNPADGERNAISGYYPQYRLAAIEMLRLLRADGLDFIRMADPTAGRTDDFQVATRTRLDAYQVKWSQNPGSFTLNDLLKTNDNAPSLIRQLADGWSRLKRLNPSHHVVVHLLTNDHPSVQRIIETGEQQKGRFSAFLNEAWLPLKTGKSAIPAKFKQAMQLLQSGSGLSDEDFAHFVQDCEFNFQHSIEVTNDPRVDADYESDVRSLHLELENIVASPERIVQLSRDQLLSRLGWRQRIEFASTHRFPDSYLPYREIESTTRELRRALDQHRSGYVALLGDPGAGKSTLLTNTLDRFSGRVIRYFAFVPDSSTPMMLRGEAKNFLHDITTSLDHAGFRVGKTLNNPLSVDQLLQRFHGQMRLVHEAYLRTGVMTVILVDGLDHIQRELKPGDSLLRYLPNSNEIPEGLLLVLGSQTDQLDGLPTTVQQSIRMPDRRIEIDRLSITHAFQMVSARARDIPLSREQVQETVRLAAGHPLALTLLVSQIDLLTNPTDIDNLLKESTAFTGLINDIYAAHWRQIIEASNDDVLGELLGKIARIRRPLDLRWIESWAGVPLVSRLRRKTRHLFQREDANRWTFFHNSFRLFLVSKTAEGEPGEFDEHADQGYHLTLAELCASQPTSSLWNWESSYHLRAAGQIERVVSETSAETLRAQLVFFRSIQSIYHELRETIRGAASLEDMDSVFRLLFIAAEFESLESGMTNAHFHELLLDMDEIDKALQLVRSGRDLMLNNNAAMDFATKLLRKGYEAEAKRIFDLAEPIATLNERPKDAHGIQRESLDELETWAKNSVYFRPVSETVSMILGVQVYEAFVIHERSDAEKTRDFQHHLLNALATSLAEALRWEEFEEVVSVLQKRAGSCKTRLIAGETQAQEGDWSAKWYCFLSLHRGVDAAYQVGQNKIAGRLLGRMRKVIPLTKLPDRGKVMLAECVFRIEGDRDAAGKVFGMASKVPEMPIAGNWNSFEACRHIVEFFRAAYLLGYSEIVPDMIPDADEDYKQPSVIFKRGLSVIGKAWAMAWNQQQLSGTAFCQEYGLLLRLFHRPLSREGFSHWSLLTGFKSDFYGLLIDAARSHGDAVVVDLASMFEQAWNNDGVESWGADHVRAIILHLFRVGVSSTWCLRMLELTGSQLNDETDQSGRVDWRLDQAAALVELGAMEKAGPLLTEIPSVAGGIGFSKDYQMLEWISLLKRVNRVDQDRSAERNQFFIRAVESLKVSAERRTFTFAAEALVAAVFSTNPQLAVTLVERFAFDGTTSFLGAVSAVINEALVSTNSSLDQCADFIECIIMPVTLYDGASLAGKAVLVLNDRAGQRAAQKYLDNFVASIQRKVSPGKREDWLNPLRSVAVKLELNHSQIPALVTPARQDPFGKLRIKSTPGASIEKANSVIKNSVSTLDEYTLLGETSLDAEQVNDMIKSVADMLRLMELESDSSHYDWTPQLERVALKLPADEVFSLAPNVVSGWRSSRCLLALSKRLEELNDPRAFDVAEMAFVQSDSHGWNPHHDGGDLVSAARQLLKLDMDRGSLIVRASFIEHLTSGRFYTRQIVENLETVLDLLRPDGGVEGIFTLVEAYLKTMFPQIAASGTTPVLGKNNGANTVSRAIATVGCSLLGHSTYHGEQCSMEFAARRLLVGDADVIEALASRLRDGEDATLDALIAVQAAANEASISIDPFVSQLRSLAVHRNFSLRCIARDLLQAVGQPAAEPAEVDIHAIYRTTIVLPPGNSRIGPDFRQSDGALRDTDDPFALVGPWQEDINLVSESTGLPFDLVLSRVIRIMRDLEPEDHWRAAAETRLRSELSNSGMEFVFRSPRPALARRAIFHAIGELADGRVLDRSELDRLEHLLRIHDPKFVLNCPDSRPAEIAFVDEPDERTFDATWTTAIPDDLTSMFADRIGGRVVVGEWTRHHPKSHRTVTEERLSQLWSSHAIVPNDLSAERFVPHLVRIQHDDYYTEECDHDHLVVAHLHYGFQTKCSEWLAFSPDVARKLGWTPCQQGLFAWEKDGVLMVESIHWVDGCTEHRSRIAHGGLASGWIVLATAEAMRMIQTHSGKLSRFCCLTRRVVLETGTHHHTHYAKSNLKPNNSLNV